MKINVVHKRDLARSKIIRKIKLNLIISVETTREWMKILGFLQNRVYDHFYVDHHEPFPNMKCITHLSHKYLCMHEPYLPRYELWKGTTYQNIIGANCAYETAHKGQLFHVGICVCMNHVYHDVNCGKVQRIRIQLVQIVSTRQHIKVV